MTPFKIKTKMENCKKYNKLVNELHTISERLETVEKRAIKGLGQITLAKNVREMLRCAVKNAEKPDIAMVFEKPIFFMRKEYPGILYAISVGKNDRLVYVKNLTYGKYWSTRMPYSISWNPEREEESYVAGSYPAFTQEEMETFFKKASVNLNNIKVISQEILDRIHLNLF